MQNWRSHFGLRWICVGFSSSSINHWIYSLNSTVNIEPLLYLPSDPHSCPFDLSFDQYPASLPNKHTDALSQLSVPISLSVAYLLSLPLILLLPMFYKLLRPIPAHIYRSTDARYLVQNKSTTSIVTSGDTLIGNLLDQNMLLIPFAIDPLGRFGPLLHNFLFGHHPAL